MMNFRKKDSLKEEIVITSFINPNAFYYRYVEKDEELELLDDVVAEAAKVAKQEQKYITGQYVIVEFLPEKKFLRGIIDDVKTNYIIWAIDYGFPITTSAKYLYKMAKELQEFDGTYVHFGGISNVIPAKEIFHHSKGKVNIIKEKSWNEIAMNVMTAFLNDSHKIFLLKDRLLPIGDRYQILCDLEITQPNNNAILFKEYLLQKMFSLEVPQEEFETTLNKIRTNAIVRWKNYALVECCKRNELPRTVQFFDIPEKVLKPAASVECDNDDDDDESIELNEKISDWNFRNELESRKEPRVPIAEETIEPFFDDITFDDSASCAPIADSCMKSSSWIRKTRSIADVRKKYGDILPPPPSCEEMLTIDQVAPNLKPAKVEKPTSEISMRARHLEIFRKLQEQEKQEKIVEASAENIKSPGKYHKEAMENFGAVKVDNLWSTDHDNVSIDSTTF